jgi:hypothetical protein
MFESESIVSKLSYNLMAATSLMEGVSETNLLAVSRLREYTAFNWNFLLSWDDCTNEFVIQFVPMIARPRGADMLSDVDAVSGWCDDSVLR